MLSKNITQQIDNWLKKFPADKKRAAVIPALTLVQDEHRWLSRDLMDAVADYLEIPKIAVYEVATFYSMFELKPVGKHKINICTNISCMLAGSQSIVDHLKQKLNIDFGETTTDDKFTLKQVECLAACGGAPMVQINKDYHENLTAEKIDAILAELD